MNQTIILYLIIIIHQPSIAQNCKPDCSNRPKKECKQFEIQLGASLIRCTTSLPSIKETETTTPICEEIEQPKYNQNTLKCTKKISLTLKMFSKGETTTTKQYIIIDHIKDGKTGERVALLNPYVIVIRQQEIMQLFGLKFLSVINGEVTEKVLNKRNPNFKGCDATCGKVFYNQKVIPYSQGFCCTCNKEIQSKEQLKADETDTPLKLQEFIYHNMKPDNKIVFNKLRRHRFKPYGLRDYLRRHRSQNMIYVTPELYHNRFPKNVEDYPQKNHIRNSQNCSQNETNKESAHCAQFSNVWYSVYQISNPILEHTIYVKIFEKRENDNGETDWFDLTPKSCIEAGSLNSKYTNKLRTLQVKYYNRGSAFIPIIFALDKKKKRILVPRPSENDEGLDENANPAEFLVVNEKDIDLSGDQCDTAGVGYKAFFNQPNRCSVPIGSCLKNQPNQLWRQDKMICKRGKSHRGKCFLKNFARVPTQDAIRTTVDKSTKYLALYYDEKLNSALDIDIQVDDNTIFQTQPRAQITEIYVDGTNEAATTILIKIFNNGLISSSFHPKLCDCPLELPVEWSNLEGDPVLIPPQHHAAFNMRMIGTVSVSDFFCSVEALNDKSEVIAMRRIRIIKNDRCICAWHCHCACLKKTGLACKLISLNHYKAAGFIGSMPTTSTMVQKNSVDNALFSVCYTVLLLTSVLLIMGFAKAVIGICCIPIGIWGLDVLIGLRPMLHYHDKRLRCKFVEYDSEGWPIHPDTKQRSVRITPITVEFFLNLIFFFSYPFMLILIICIKLCCPHHPNTAENHTENMYPESTHSNMSTDSEDLEQFEFDDSEDITDEELRAVGL